MATPLLSGAQGNPARLQRRIAPQPTLGLPVITSMRDFRSNAGSLAIDKSTVPRATVTSGAAPGVALPGKATLGDNPIFMGDVDPTDRGLLLLFANLFGQYDNVDQTTYRDWDFALDGATAADKYLTMREDNDVLPRMTAFDMMVFGAQFQAGPGANFAVQFSRGAGGYYFWGDGTQTAGSGSTIPTITRTAPANWDLDATSADLKVKIITVSGEDITIDVAQGAAAFGGNNQAYTMGDPPLRLLREDASRYGTVREQVRFFIPAGSTLVVNDEFTFPKRIAARWSPTLAAEQPIAAVNTQFFVDGLETRVEGGWIVSAAYATGEVVPDTSNEQGGTPDRAGNLVVTLTPTRRITNLDFQKALHERSTVTCVIDAFTESVITGVIEHRCSLIFPSLAQSGSMYGAAEGAQNKDEAPVLIAQVPTSAFSWDGRTFDSHFHVWIRNNVTAL